jgi:hypothetical protein
MKKGPSTQKINKGHTSSAKSLSPRSAALNALNAELGEVTPYGAALDRRDRELKEGENKVSIENVL